MTDDEPTQQIPAETLAECAAAWAKHFAQQAEETSNAE